MKQPLQNSGMVFTTTISMQQLVAELMRESGPVAHYNKTHIVNEVETGIRINSVFTPAILVMSELFATVVSNSRNGDIHVSAASSGNQIVFEIQERNNYNGYALAFSVGAMAPEASSLGGQITIQGPRQKMTTISFSFPKQFAV